MESRHPSFKQLGHQKLTLVSRLMSGALKPIVVVTNKSKLFLVFKRFIVLSSDKRKLLKITTKGKTVASQGRVKKKHFILKQTAVGKLKRPGNTKNCSG